MDDMYHDLQTIGRSYFPKNKPPKLVIDKKVYSSKIVSITQPLQLMCKRFIVI